jgi:hypothetical protein
MEEQMNRRHFMTLAGALAIAGSGSQAMCAEEHNDAELIKALAAAKVSLQQGLAAASAKGQPISAKFEVEDGKFQLSVYTAKDGKFFEVIVDHVSGSVTKSEEITSGDDLTAAKAQSAAMAKAKTDLKTAVETAASQAAGARAVSVTPALKAGRAVAALGLVSGQQLKTIEQSLD